MGTNQKKTEAKKTKVSIKKKKFDKRKILNSVVIVFLSIVMICGVGVFFILNDVLANSPDFESGKLSAKDSTRLFDKNGDLIIELGEENRENIEFEQIPQTVIDAFLAIEDSRFYAHNGFDLPRFIKSAMVNVSAGSFAQGGSTLTMQMIDNAFFSSNIYDPEDPSTYSAKPTNNPIEKVSRKIQEIFLSMRAEKELNKDDILKLYLNKINFGDTARGIQKGSQYYFGKDISEITLSEAAFLAGVINAPNTYNPYNGYVYNEETGIGTDHYELAVERRNSTLYQMRNHGYITEEEYNLAKSTELAFQLNGKQNFVTDPYQGYIDAVVKEAKKMTGDDNPYVVPMDIYTSMDPGAQQQADAITNGEVVNLPDDADFQMGFTLMNNQTGEIAAIGAGRDVKINRAYEPRQPGSSIKPILDYAPAFEHLGWATSHQMEDKAIDIYGTGQMLQNANGTYQGSVTLEKAVAESLNTTAVQALKGVVDKVGQDGMVKYLKNMGYSNFDEDNFSLQYGIGGSTMVASPTEMAGAYAALGNGGKYTEPHTIKKIVYKDDSSKTIETEAKTNQAISSEAAFMMSDVLHNAVTKNYKNFLYILRGNYSAYGKTGTSDWGTGFEDKGIPTAAMKDIWMVGYTSEYTIATWCGYDGGIYKYITTGVNDMNIPGKIDKAMLDYVADNISSPAPIAQPEGVVSITHLKGKFPYVKAPSGASGNSIVTGLIKKDYAALKDYASSTQMSSLSSFSASLKSGTTNVVQIKFGAYPGSIAEEDKDILGNVIFKVDVKLNGSILNSFTYTSESADQTISGVKEGETIQVCGYYAFSNSEQKSNEVCNNVTFPKAQKPVEPEKPETPDPDNPDNTKP